MSNPIYVTQPDLPPLDDFIPYLKKIWDSKIITNGGPYHEQLELALTEYLGVKYLSLCSNGTLGLIIGLKALGISGEVITTPYSFVATAHSLLWNGIEPVFVDIDSVTLNIDPKLIEAAITEKTSAILAVHCYGRSCDVDAIQKIADKYNLKIIYDSAHAFGVNDSKGSILNYGDLSVLSFHATKVFHTFEGGAIVSKNKEMKQRIDNLKNFGFINETCVNECGINGKMSEINAAFGLLQLPNINELIKKRNYISDSYNRHLKGISGIELLNSIENNKTNNSYFPILIKPNYKLSRDELYVKLKNSGIFSRRYFYPLISNFPMYNKLRSAFPENLKNANLISSQVLCLPIYSKLLLSDVVRISEIIAD